MFKLILIYLLTIIQIITFSQESNLFFEIDGEKIYKDEFLNNYLKNNDKPKYDKQSLDEYIDLFVTYKQKVNQAKKMGLDTLQSFKREYEKYENQTAEKYLTNKKIDENIFKEAKDRYMYEIKASHILIEIDPKNEEASLKKINDIRNRALKGENWENLCKKYSIDGTKDMGGDLGYFTCFDMVYPFESMAYNTKIGNISEPVKTEFGYHIIKVLDKRKSKGRYNASHIFVSADEEQTEEQAIKKINDIYSKLNDNNFAQIASEFSEDSQTKKKGGNISWFIAGKMEDIFEENLAKLELKKYSKPFKTSYGWHIAKKEDYEERENIKDLDDIIRAKLKRSDRSNISRSEFVNMLKKEYNFTDLSSNNLNYNLIDDNKTVELSLDDIKHRLASYTYKNHTNYITTSDFKKYISKNNISKNKEKNIKSQYNEFIESEMINFERSILAEKYPEYKSLTQEFRDGILIFDISSAKVWAKSNTDTTGIKEYYEKHKNDYMWGERTDCEIYYSDNKNTINECRKLLKKGKNNIDIINELNKDNVEIILFELGKYEKGENKIVDKIDPKQKLSDIIEIEKRFYVVKSYGILSPQPKQLNQCRSKVISDYYNFLDDEWKKELEDNKNVTIYRDNIYKLNN